MSSTRSYLKTLQHYHESEHVPKLFSFVKLYTSQMYKLGPNANIAWEIRQKARKATLPN